MDQTVSVARHRIGPAEFITLIAAMMALTALSIDIMLPALPAIGDAFGVLHENDRQAVVTAYLLGFGLAQLVHGPLSDRFGRKPPLMVGLAVYAVGSLLVVFAPSFAFLLAARFIQGLGCAAPRVIAIAVVRDLYAGRHMARIMSYVMTVFIIVPVVAPSIGGALLLVGEWQWIFWFLFAVAIALLVWSTARLPETRPAELRAPLSVLWLARAARITLTSRATVGYTLGTALAFGSLLAYVNSAQQIFADIYDAEAAFPLIFGAIAAVLAVAAFVNGRLVERIGMRPLSHVALVAFTAIGVVHVLVALAGWDDLLAFSLLIGADLLAFGFIMPNFNAMAMEPVGEISGTASAFIGCVQTSLGALLGYLVGRAFDGTVIPLATGFALFGFVGILVVLATERGRLFRTHHPR